MTTRKRRLVCSLVSAFWVTFGVMRFMQGGYTGRVSAAFGAVGVAFGAVALVTAAVSELLDRKKDTD